MRGGASSDRPGRKQYVFGGRQSSAGGGAYAGLSASAPYHQLSSGNSSPSKFEPACRRRPARPDLSGVVSSAPRRRRDVVSHSTRRRSSYSALRGQRQRERRDAATQGVVERRIRRRERPRQRRRHGQLDVRGVSRERFAQRARAMSPMVPMAASRMSGSTKLGLPQGCLQPRRSFWRPWRTAAETPTSVCCACIVGCSCDAPHSSRFSFATKDRASHGLRASYVCGSFMSVVHECCRRKKLDLASRRHTLALTTRRATALWRTRR